MTITDFLLARLDSDEGRAHGDVITVKAGVHTPSRHEGHLFIPAGNGRAHRGPAITKEAYGELLAEMYGSEYVVFDEKLLAEVRFKRAMLDGHESDAHRCAWGDYVEGIACQVKAALMPVYASHPDYDPGWAV